MTAFLIYWRVLIETARRSQDAGSDLGSLIIDARTLLRRSPGSSTPPLTPPAGAVWDTGPLPEINFSFPGSDISAMAYLGALAPDIPSYQKGLFREKMIYGKRVPRSPDWANILHVNRSGEMLRTLLEHIANIPSPAVRSQALAFAMGYVSHIATDIALNPCINALAGAYRQSYRNRPIDIRSYIALCLDEYLAEQYFNHPLHTWTNQPWGHYIEPSARHMLHPGMLSAQVLNLLTSAAEATYNLSEEQSRAFQQSYLAGLQPLRHYLAGRGVFRLLTFYALTRNRTNDPIRASIVANSRGAGMVTFEEVITYATRLSEHLCRRAIGYYASLRNTQATAEERNQRRRLLNDDLRNWDLNTGYTMDVTFDEQVTLHLVHNWVHFARFWEPEEGEDMRPFTSLTNSTST